MTESFPRQLARTRRFTLGEPRSFTICADGRRVLFLRALSGADSRTGLWCLDLHTGRERLVVDATRLGDEDDLPAEERARRERVRESASGVVAFAADDAGDVVAFAAAGRLWRADLRTDALDELAAAAGVFDPRPDPTGSRIAYVSGRDLRVIGADGSDDRVLAGDADEAVSWGRAEFVAGEEMERTRGYWWSPEGTALLAARVDETAVAVRWIADPAHPDQPPRPVRYPAAGTPNADVSLHLLGVAGERRPIEWDRGSHPYLARVVWTAGRAPIIQVQSRDQRSARVLLVDVTTGETTTAYDDQDDIWAEIFPGAPSWCGDRIVRIRDADGARRLYVGDDPVTGPEVYVRGVAGAGADGVVFAASLGDPTQVHLLRWTAAGVEQLTEDPGVHTAIAAGSTVVISSASLEQHGATHTVHGAGAAWPVASCAETPSLTPQVQLLALGDRQLAAGLLLPRNHTPGTKLPVLLDPYGGPHAQRVLSARRIWLEPQWWADQGFAVLVIDGAGTPGRGPAWEREINRDVAGPVLADQVAGLHAAAELEPDLDLSRVAIRGWSFGGYLAALAVLQRPDVFHVAVAGAPAIEWSLYDTHYTERYLGTPQEEPEVYRRTSLLDLAPSLSRPLLLIHGLADDNVLAAHTLLMSQRLTEAGRPHSVLPLTGVTHMTPQEDVAENLLLLQLDFVRRALALD